MGVGRTQIQQIIKRKSEVLDDYESNVSNDRKRKKHKTGNEDINDLCWDWVQDAINFTFPFNHLLYLRSSNAHYLCNISRTFPTIM
jgi:hypothetical protein